ncbi:hypothetical protein FSP39_012007 [Pinctada imbricata]|uniref:Uncharacterized protein n=1 Tax=Pinctada imbricata TaxID=66713 RepID=A0AA89CDZ2_PINIB|nr:hypothetical protein FSP39_012007 [Pinctada imbricata]
MSSEEDKRKDSITASKLGLLDPVDVALTTSGLKLSRREGKEPEKKEFIHFPSVTYTRRQLPNTQNQVYSHGTHDIINLLISGGVPAWVFQPQYWNEVETDDDPCDHRFYKYRSPTKRDCDLWEIKRKKILLFDIEKSIVDARQRQKKMLRKVSKKADELSKRTEKVLTKNAENSKRGVEDYLSKLEKRAKMNLPKEAQEKLEHSAIRRLKKKVRKQEVPKPDRRKYSVRFPEI